MQYLFFFLFIIFLVIELGPYILIILVLLAVIFFVAYRVTTSRVTTPKRKSANNVATHEINNKSNKKTNITTFPKDYISVSKLQSKNIHSVINILKNIKESKIYNVVHRLNSLELNYWKKQTVYLSSDIYSYIINTTNERINTTKRDIVKRECEIILQIITQLKEGISADDIVHTILPLKENEVKEEVTIIKSEGSTNNEQDNDQKGKREAVEDLDNHTSIAPNVSTIVANLAVNAVRRESEQTIEPSKSSLSADKSGTIFNSFRLSKHNNDKEVSPNEGVPHWEHIYIYSVTDLQKANNLQKKFYRYFKAQFLKQQYIDIDDNSNYAFVLMFDIAEDYKIHRNYELLKQQLDTLAENYPIVARYINNTLSQAVLSVNREELKNALSAYNKSHGQLCRWVSPDEVVEVQGVKLTRGNFYIGECFRLPDNIIKDNSLIDSMYKGHYIFGAVLNPDLSAVKGDSYDIAFCCYRDMTPEWRYEYLLWLSGEKNAADVPVEILLFYLYGCEIKMFIDPTTGFLERRAILTSIIELKKSLNSNNSDKRTILLKRQLNDFIGCAYVKYFLDDKTAIEYQGILKQSDMIQDILIAKILKNEKKLRAERAYEVAVEIYDFENIIPVRYKSYAKQRFIEIFNKEIKEVPLQYSSMSYNDKRYTNHYISYNHRDCAFQSENVLLTYTTDTINLYTYSVKNAVRNCCWNVEWAFNRYKEKIALSNGEETIEAILVLPGEIDIQNIVKIQTLKKEIDSIIDNTRYGETTVNHILQLLECKNDSDQTLHKKTIEFIITGLYRLGYGIAPNFEIDRKRFNYGDICVIYRNTEHLPVKLTSKYERSELFIKLASYIVHADNVTINDFEFVEQQLKSYENIPGNHLHLTAVIRWRFLYKKQPIDKRIKDVISLLTSEQRISMGNALVRLACINGNIIPKRIDSLKKILQLLGIESENIHTQVHRLLTDSDGFAVVEKKSDAVEFTINDKAAYTQKQTGPSVFINPKKLHIFEQQTKDAQELLSRIFVEEDATTPQKTETDNAVSVWMEILNTLLTKEVWQRAEVDSMCKERGLMLGAVLEQINDYAYEKVDDAVIEDDGDNIYVTLDYKEELI